MCIRVKEANETSLANKIASRHLATTTEIDAAESAQRDDPFIMVGEATPSAIWYDTNEEAVTPAIQNDTNDREAATPSATRDDTNDGEAATPSAAQDDTNDREAATPSATHDDTNDGEVIPKHATSGAVGKTHFKQPKVLGKYLSRTYMMQHVSCNMFHATCIYPLNGL